MAASAPLLRQGLIGTDSVRCRLSTALAAMLLESTLHGPGSVAAAPVSAEALPSSTPTQKGAALGAIEAAEKATPPRAVSTPLLLPALHLVLEREGVPVVAGAAL